MSQGESGTSGTSVAVIILVVVGALALMGVCIVALGAVLIFPAVMFPAVNQARDAAQRTEDANNLKQIVLALHNHQNAMRRFPSPNGWTEDGQTPPRSWRVELLPYLEQQALYQQYDQEEAWNAPANRPLLDQIPKVYRSPRDEAAAMSANAAYVLITGPGTVFPPDREPLSFGEIKDGSSNTVICMQLPGSDIPWLEPRDVDIDQVLALFANPNGPIAKQGGVNMGLADGSVRYISADIDPQTLRALLTADGGEVVGQF